MTQRRFKYPKHLRFRCDRCALCCEDSGNKKRIILLLNSEAIRISKETSRYLHEFAKKVKGFEPYIYQMKMEDGKCVFLQDNSCAIYVVRPLICRFYPFQLKNLGNNRFAFAYTNKCPGIGVGAQLVERFYERLFEEFMELMRNS